MWVLVDFLSDCCNAEVKSEHYYPFEYHCLKCGKGCTVHAKEGEDG